MKGNNCGFLHQFDKSRMPTCRFFAKYNECREPDCPFKHSLEDVKDCNMYKLGFCIHGPNCRYRHAKQDGPPPGIQEAALIGRPGHLHGAPLATCAPCKTPSRCAKTKGPGRREGRGAGGRGAGVPRGRSVATAVAAGAAAVVGATDGDADGAARCVPGARGAGFQEPPLAGGVCRACRARPPGDRRITAFLSRRNTRPPGDRRITIRIARRTVSQNREEKETRTTPAERVAFGMARRDAFRVEFSVALFRPRSSFYFPHSSSSPQSSSASSHSFVFFSSAGAGLSLPLAEPESTLPPPFDPDAAD